MTTSDRIEQYLRTAPPEQPDEMETVQMELRVSSRVRIMVELEHEERVAWAIRRRMGLPHVPDILKRLAD